MPTLADIEAARERLGDAVYRSPCALSQTLSDLCEARVWLKLENLQMTGSFKERGALNKISQLSQNEKERGVVAASAGNHAQAVAYHATRAGIRSTIVMPRRTPLVKIANTRGYGAEVVLEGDSFDAAFQTARRLCDERQATFLHPFDDEQIIAGQGTIGLELLEQVAELDMVLVPIGGGGLISGIATAIKAIRPTVEVVGVQAAAAPSMQKSLESGRRQAIRATGTIADGIAIKRPGELTLEIVKRCVDRIVTVDEEEIANGVLILLEKEKTVAEGAGAAALAALYHDRVPGARGRRIAVVVSGGNIDVNLISRIIERGLAKDGRLVRLSLQVSDEPGTLAGVLRRVGKLGANVVEVHHNRAFNDLGLAEVDIELTLETRGRDHLDEIVSDLRDRGVAVHNLSAAKRSVAPTAVLD